MSKSYNNTIDIFGKPGEVRSTIMRIVTDSKTVEDEKTPETCNVYQLYKLFATEDQARDLAERYRKGGMGYGQAKKELYEMFDAHFGPLRRKREELESNMDYAEQVLVDGSKRARDEVRPILEHVRRAVGLQ